MLLAVPINGDPRGVRRIRFFLFSLLFFQIKFRIVLPSHLAIFNEIVNDRRAAARTQRTLFGSAHRTCLRMLSKRIISHQLLFIQISK